jgi:16S rRNA (cytosine967-C5)-methyltransferase
VQDAAAALPARLLGPVAGMSVLDLCAAPGGKTAELAAAGARVTALDVSEARVGRMRDNLARLGLEAELVAADAATWVPGRMFDAVLLDAPCTATGTIRRHPDILHLKREDDIDRLATLQRRLLDNALQLVAPGGLLVYATCSLEPEEGEGQVGTLLARGCDFDPVPISDEEAMAIGCSPEWISPSGWLRTLPFHTPVGAAPASGMDGFFAARFRRHL